MTRDRILRKLKRAGEYCIARSQGPELTDRLDYWAAYLIILKAYQTLEAELKP